MASSPKALLSFILAFGIAGTLGAIPTASAAPLPADLSAAGSLGFDTPFASAELAGTGTQTGTFRAISGGSVASSTYSGDIVGGLNPLPGSPSQTGDGLGIRGSASALARDDRFGVGIDLGFGLANVSLLNAYRVRMLLSYTNTVDASGTDAFADSEFSLSRGGSEIFATDLVSDSFFGNSVDGTPDGNFGGPLTRTGAVVFDVDLLAGDTADFTGFWTLRGGTFSDDGRADSFFDVFFEISSFELLNQPPRATPAPGTLALLLIGLAGLLTHRRKCC